MNFDRNEIEYSVSGQDVEVNYPCKPGARRSLLAHNAGKKRATDCVDSIDPCNCRATMRFLVTSSGLRFISYETVRLQCAGFFLTKYNCSI